MSKAGRRLVVRLFFSACVALSFSCGHSSPTEPTATRATLNLSIAPSFIPLEVNSLVVQSDTCACTKSPVTISVNGVIAGTVACGETKSLPIHASADNLQILVQSPEIYALTGGIFLKGQGPTDPGPLPITLTCSPR